MSHQIYTKEEFLNRMSYLLPIATNFVDNKNIQVPINIESTVASLNRLFKKENTENNENYALDLWNNSPLKFVNHIMYNYWSDDPLYETNIDLTTLKQLSFPAMQYIALQLTNVNNRNNDLGLNYKTNEVFFYNLDQVIEVFQYMSNLQFVDYTTNLSVLGNVTDGISFRTNGEIKNEEKLKCALKDEQDKIKREQEKLEFEQKLANLGLTKPTMSAHDIANQLQKLVSEFNKVYLRELDIRRDISKREQELKQNYSTRLLEENAFSSYFLEQDALTQERKNRVTEVYQIISQLKERLEVLKRESMCRDEYDKLVWGSLSTTLSDSLKSLQDGIESTLVLVNTENDIQSDVTETSENTMATDGMTVSENNTVTESS